MKAVIRLDVPDWQIGQEVYVYFLDTMMMRSVCEEEKQENHSQEECENCAMAIESMQIVRCKNCKCYDEQCQQCVRIDGIILPDFFCADGERKDT